MRSKHLLKSLRKALRQDHLYDVEEFKDLISDLVSDGVRINQLGAVIGTHRGPRLLGHAGEDAGPHAQ